MAASDSDELDGFDPTTPYKPPPKKRAPVPKPPPSQARAGPSKTRPAPRAAPKKAPVAAEEPLEIDDDEVAEAEIEEIVDADPAPPRSNTTATNGNARGKGKGTKRMETPVVIDASSDDGRRTATNGTGKGKKPARRDASPAPSAREFARLKKQLEEVTAQRDDLMNQMQELITVRMTEPEEELQIAAAQYEASLAAKEQMYQAVVEELGRCQPLFAAGNTSLVHFLSREDADAEKAELRASLDQVSELSSRRAERIQELEAELAAVKVERDAEIKRSKELQNAIPRAGRVVPSGKGGDDPLKGASIKLYESLTNLLILHVKLSEGQNPDEPDSAFNCCYTSDTGSLSFLLECNWGPDEAAEDPDNAPLACIDKFSPQDLDKESPEFVQRLQYLSGTISFSHAQVHILFQDLRRFMDPPQEEEAAEESMVVEVD